ncbi:hypothetical protein L7F22_047873 [Adiantum nelumboides]|nr:hypothetical protein [Adiantum nelumboides]
MGISWDSMHKRRAIGDNNNASNNELVRTQTLVKSAIIQVDAAPFHQWYNQHYGSCHCKKESKEEAIAGEGEKKQSKHVLRKVFAQNGDHKLDQHLEDQFASGRLLACISSRPGQFKRADGYILEGKELEFYQRKIQRKKGKTTGSVASSQLSRQAACYE